MQAGGIVSIKIVLTKKLEVVVNGNHGQSTFSSKKFIPISKKKVIVQKV